MKPSESTVIVVSATGECSLMPSEPRAVADRRDVYRQVRHPDVDDGHRDRLHRQLGTPRCDGSAAR